MALLFEWDNKKAQSNKRKHGISINEKLIVVVHADRDDIIRIISARSATRHEREQYEQA